VHPFDPPSFWRGSTEPFFSIMMGTDTHTPKTLK
jgi:hypothetical protein